ncbi:XVIPCD domain-containing protein [Xanthomonas sp. NCPPB 2632]|uniref:XVIPCD domain-containing protein n=1 Tax=Xanthomonas sp. NCPPB 2632 TaxID=3240912 RepID=UPI003516DEE5
MADLTDNELRAVAYFSIGVSSEGKDASYRLAFAGNTVRDAAGNVNLQPVGNSGYTIGTLQTDFGAHPADARQLVAAYQGWANENHPEWVLTDEQQAKMSADLGRDGNHVRDANFDAHLKQYQKKKDIPASLMPAGGPDIDQTFKSHLNEYLATDTGKTFVHERDVTQVNKLMDRVAEPLKDTDLYQKASTEDKARIFAVVAKAYNQGDAYGDKLITGIQDGKITSLDGLKSKVGEFPDYFHSGRDEALKGADTFNAMKNASADGPLKGAWDAVLADPLVNPTTLAKDTAHPDLAAQYGTVKGIFIDPVQGRGLVQDMDKGASHSHGDPASKRSRGYYAQGKDLVQWDMDGHGRSYIDGKWSEVSRSDLSLQRNKDHSRDLKITQDGHTRDLLHVVGQGAQKQGEPKQEAPKQGDHAALRQGTHGSDVEQLQTKLAALGYLNNTVTPDGKFGSTTKAAVEAFQQDRKLDVDGVAGNDTLKVLADQVRAKTETATAAQLPGRLDHPDHPDHAMFQQARDQVYVIDRRLGRTPDLQSDQIASALVVQARSDGLQRIDQVALSEDGSRMWAVQTPPGQRDHLADLRTNVPTAAANTSMEQSGGQWPQAMERFEAAQQQQATERALAQNQNQQQAAPGLGR